jgi:hypothetical protein
VAQKLLGHTEITTTKRYAHVEMEDVRAAMDAVSRQDSATARADEKANELNKQEKVG